MSENAESIIQEIDREHARLGTASYYDLLNVTETTGEDEIRTNFRALAKRFHGDRYAGLELPTDTKKKMTQLLGQISRAHSVLTNSEKRKDYDATLAMQAAGIPTDLGTIVEAESLFRQGQRLLEQGLHGPALAKLDAACKLNPAEPEFAATAAFCKYWTLSKGKAGKPKDRHAVKLIIDHLTGYLKEHPKNDAVYLHLGVLAKTEGNVEHAIGYFREALAINAKNHHAAREIRLYQMRAKKKSGFFQKLFGKK